MATYWIKKEKDGYNDEYWQPPPMRRPDIDDDETLPDIEENETLWDSDARLYEAEEQVSSENTHFKL